MRALVASEPDATAAEVVAALDLARGGRPGLPRVVAIMIASADGRATAAGRSVALGHPEDRALLRGLRAQADCLLAGTRTLAAERYGRLLDPVQGAARRAAGRADHPLVATVSRAGRFPWEVPVLAQAGVAKQLYTGAPVAVPAGVEDVGVEPLTAGLRGVLTHLFDARGVRSVACEGGPTLLRALLAEDLVDDLLLTLAPVLVAGDGPTPLTGPELPWPPRLALRDVRRADDHLFLHYAR